jgi:hypothetical protein
MYTSEFAVVDDKNVSASSASNTQCIASPLLVNYELITSHALHQLTSMRITPRCTQSETLPTSVHTNAHSKDTVRIQATTACNTVVQCECTHLEQGQGQQLVLVLVQVL